MRTNFRNFMAAKAETPITIDGVSVFAGGVFDRIGHIINENMVGKAIRYIGEIANAYGTDSTVTSIDTGTYEPDGYQQQLGEQPQSAYGLSDFESNQWSTLLNSIGLTFFPGLTNRVAMICSFGINRNDSPDSNGNYTAVGNEQLSEDTSSDTQNRKLTYGYGFLPQYKTFLDLCPKLVNETGGLTTPSVSNIDALNVIIYYGGLDVKHTRADAEEMQSYFVPGKAHIINHRYLDVGAGEDNACSATAIRNFWDETSTITGSVSTVKVALGDGCEDTNSATASGLTGW